MLHKLLERNAVWAAMRRAENPGYFEQLSKGQEPTYLWIGCSDSRVPENVVGGLGPGEIFAHRNVANLVHSTDVNLLSALEFGVNELGIREIIVCGHTGCGGIAAAMRGPLEGVADHWLETIRRLARRNEEVLSALPEGPARNDKLAEISVVEMVDRAVRILGGGGVPIIAPLDSGDCIVRVDKRRFGRVIANLLDNAQNYAGGATAVTIDRDGDLVLIAVEDRGNGVPADERDIIFDRFSRGSEGGNRSSDSGVGLGLALVDEHVRLHGGRVWVEDRRDGEHGARFVVELPLIDPPSRDGEEHP